MPDKTAGCYVVVILRRDYTEMKSQKLENGKVIIEGSLFTVPLDICDKEVGNSDWKQMKWWERKDKAFFNKLPYSVPEANKKLRIYRMERQLGVHIMDFISKVSSYLWCSEYLERQLESKPIKDTSLPGSLYTAKRTILP